MARMVHKARKVQRLQCPRCPFFCQNVQFMVQHIDRHPPRTFREELAYQSLNTRDCCEGCGSELDLFSDPDIDGMMVCRDDAACRQRGVAVWNQFPTIWTWATDGPTFRLRRALARFQS